MKPREVKHIGNRASKRVRDRDRERRLEEREREEALVERGNSMG